jgi:type II secretory pathway pseudopilin PulG
MSAAKPDPKLPLGGEPRVQLLPQSVRDRVKAAATRRRLGMVVVLSLVLVGGGYAFAFLQNVTAQQQLETARQQTQAVLTEQAQYAEGSRAAALVSGIRTAQYGVTAHEIDWDAVLDAVRALLPEGTTLDEANVVVQAPWEPALSIEGPLRAPRIATLTLSFVGPNIVDPVSTTTKLSKLTGFVDARFDSTTAVDGVYKTIVRLMLSADATSQRFPDPSGAAEPTEEQPETEETSQAEGSQG